MANPLNVSSREQFDKIHAYMDTVCRIVVRDENKEIEDLGTGFLIGPNLLMTCNHVIPNIATAQKAEAQFFKHSSVSERPTGGERNVHLHDYVKFDLNSDMFFHSPPKTKVENRKTHFLPAGKNFLDYTILPLEQDPNLGGRVHFFLSAARAPNLGEHHYLYHHPEAPSRESHSGLEVKGDFGVGGGSVVKKGAYECHYATPTRIGSSGGPVVGNDANLIALHYQCVGNDECSKPLKHICNAGVNMAVIKEHLGQSNLKKIEGFNEESQAYYQSLPQEVSEIITQIDLLIYIYDKPGSISKLSFITKQANQLYDLIIGFIKNKIDDPPSSGQYLLKSINLFEQVLNGLHEITELTIALSRPYYLLLEITWYQYWYHLQQPKYKRLEKKIKQLTDSIINELPAENKVKNEFLSTIDTKFFLQCAQQAAQCLNVHLNLWTEYQGKHFSKAPSEARREEIYNFLSSNEPNMSLEGWYIINWKLNWLSNRVKSLELFEKEIEPILETHQFSRTENALTVIIAFMTILKNPEAELELKNAVLHGVQQRYKGLKNMITLEKENIYTFNLPNFDFLSNFLGGIISVPKKEPDLFKEPRYLALQYLFQLATDSSHPCKKESHDILVEEFKKTEDQFQRIDIQLSNQLISYNNKLESLKEKYAECQKEIDSLDKEIIEQEKKLKWGDGSNNLKS